VRFHQSHQSRPEHPGVSDGTGVVADVPLPKKWSCADTVIAHTSLPNLRHPAGAIAPPLLKGRKSTINILRESDVAPTQALPLPKTAGDQNGPQPKAGGDHNIPQHHKATFETAKTIHGGNRIHKDSLANHF